MRRLVHPSSLPHPLSPSEDHRPPPPAVTTVLPLLQSRSGVSCVRSHLAPALASLGRIGISVGRPCCPMWVTVNTRRLLMVNPDLAPLRWPGWSRGTRGRVGVESLIERRSLPPLPSLSEDHRPPPPTVTTVSQWGELRQEPFGSLRWRCWVVLESQLASPAAPCGQLSILAVCGRSIPTWHIPAVQLE